MLHALEYGPDWGLDGVGLLCMQHVMSYFFVPAHWANRDFKKIAQGSSIELFQKSTPRKFHTLPSDSSGPHLQISSAYFSINNQGRRCFKPRMTHLDVHLHIDILYHSHSKQSSCPPCQQVPKIVEHPYRSDISSHCPLVQEFWRFQRMRLEYLRMRSPVDIMCH